MVRSRYLYAKLNINLLNEELNFIVSYKSLTLNFQYAIYLAEPT